MPLPSELKQEIASVERDINYAIYGGVLENPDKVLQKRGSGKGLKLYDEIEEDAHAYAVLQKRKLAVIARPWEVKAASEKRIDKKAADVVKAQLENKLDQLTLDLLDSTLKGFSVVESMWSDSGSEIFPAEFKARDQRRFVFDSDYKLRLLTPQNMVTGEPVPERKFIRHTFGSKDGNPFGKGLGSKLYFPVWFKRQGISFWLVFCDKFGMPTVVGKYGQNATSADQKKLLDALRAIAQDAGVIIPEGMDIALLEASRSSTSDLYEKLVRYMDEQISEAVLSETLTTNIGAIGSKAASETHNGVRLEITKADADLLSATLNNTLCRWITELNVPGASPPTIWRIFEEQEDLERRSTRDKTLFDMGYKLKPDAVKEIYGDYYVDASDSERQPQNDEQFLKNSGVEQTGDEQAQQTEETPSFVELTEWLEFQSLPNEIDFAEPTPIKSVDDLLALRDIIQGVYLDGISAIPEAYLDGENFVGIFEDEINNQLTKRFSFVLSESGIRYKLLNPNDVNNYDFAEVEFAASRQKKKKNCTKGISCGDSCIAANKICRKGSGDIDKGKVTKLKKRVKGGGKTEPEPKVTGGGGINYKVDRGDYRALIGLGEEFAAQYIEMLTETPEEQKRRLELFAKMTKGRKLTKKEIKEAQELDQANETRRQKNDEQFQRLKEAVASQNGITEYDARMWSKSLTYVGATLNNESALEQTQNNLAEIYRLTGGKGANSIVIVSADQERASTSSLGNLDVGRELNKMTVYHEYSHHIEFNDKQIANASRDWIESRATSSTPQKLKDLTGYNYGDDEVALPDKFISAYVGKIYGEKGSPTEVITMGVEKFSNPAAMRQLYQDDPEHFHLVLGVLLSQ